MKSSTPHPVGIELPPVPDEVAKLLIVGSNNEHNYEKRLHETKSLLSEIHKWTEVFRKKCEPVASEPSVGEIPKFAAPHLVWAKHKLARLQEKQQLLARNIYTKVFSVLTLTEFFIERALESKIPVFMNLDGIKPMMQSMFEQDPEWIKVKFRIGAMHAFVDAHKDDIVMSGPSVDLCIRVLDECSNRCDASKGFAYYSFFDKCLLDYLWCEELDAVDRVARALSPMVDPPEPAPQQMRKSTSSSSMKQKGEVGSLVLVSPKARANMRVKKNCVRASVVEPFLSMYERLGKLFRVDNIEKEIVLMCAFVRIVFDRMYLIDPTLQSGNGVIQRGLDIVRCLKVTDMDVPTGVFENEDVEIGHVCEKNTVIREVLQFADSLNFCSNPLDITETVYTISNTIHGLQKLSEPNMDICFDDFFSVFVVLFSASPPVNACGIAHLLDAHAYIELPQSLKHAAASFGAWVSYLQSFPVEEHSPEMKEKIDKIVARLDSQ